MTKKTEEKLKFLTEEEIKEKIKNLNLSQRWEVWLDIDFSWYYFWDWIKNEWNKNEIRYYISKDIFKWLDLSWADFSNSKISSLIFYWTNLSLTNFKWAEFNGKIDVFTNFEWADFRWENTKYDIQNFSDKQKKQIIFTDDDYEKYQEKLEKENKELKEITKNTSEEQTNKLTESFEKLENRFLKEEIRWLFISFIWFFSLLFFFAIPILDMFAYQYTYKIIFWAIIVIIWLIFTIATTAALANLPKDENKNNFWLEMWLFIKKWWPIIIYMILVKTWLDSYLKTLTIPNSPIFNVDKNFALIPFGLLLVTFLYFSIYQYSKSKKLRIENQNKVALLHWFIALRTDTWTDYKKELFYNNIANVVFDKIYQGKENNLPIDKIIDLVKLLEKR